MNNEYQTKTTIDERLEYSELKDGEPVIGQPGDIPTNTLGVYNRPTGISMVDSKGLPAVLFGLLFIAALIVLLVWLL
ncbi:MAG TPA: hypothetical protein VNI84_13575 [Pyrinomonadaceae bacterium]|nr:hypothetical protein [Pyrinomonadaceae bacterium]